MPVASVDVCLRPKADIGIQICCDAQYSPYRYDVLC
jgi:hypothetical protein